MPSAGKRITARGLVVDGQRLLMMERWQSGMHYFSIPGGGVEPDEELDAAAEREIEEETAVQIQILRKVYEMEMEDSLHHIYLCRYLSGTPQLLPHSEEGQHQWSGNRFEPKWIEISQLESLPLGYWQPLKKQLVHDLNHGFNNQVVKFVP